MNTHDHTIFTISPKTYIYKENLTIKANCFVIYIHFECRRKAPVPQINLECVSLLTVRILTAEKVQLVSRIPQSMFLLTAYPLIL